jgi:methylaspartate mutase epsilon subunit
MSSAIKIRNRKLDDDEFLRIRREEVLSQWETGKEIENLDECISAAKELSQGKNVAQQFESAKRAGDHVLIPMFGRALTEYMIEGLQYVERESALAPGGHWTIFSDSYTRKGNFAAAGAALERSRKEGMSLLNGWPVVNYGVEEARRIMRASSVPLYFNSTDEDGRLAACRTEVFSRIVTSVISPAMGKLAARRAGAEAILGLLKPAVGSMPG